MLIRCGKCKTKLKLPDTAAGKRIKCPSCAVEMQIPAATPTAQTPTSPPKRSPKRKPKSSSASTKPKPAPRKKSRPSPKRDSDPAKRSRASKPIESVRSSGGSSGRKRKRVKSRRSDGYSDDEWGNEWDDDFVEDYDDPYRPARSSNRNRNKKGNSDGLRMAGLGLLISAWSTVATWGLSALTIVYAIFTGVFRESDAPIEAPFIVNVIAVLPIFGVFGGLILSTFVPKKSGAKTYAILSATGMGLYVLLILVAGVTGDFDATKGESPGPVLLTFMLFVLFAMFVGYLAYFWFLKHLAEFVKRDDLAGQAMTILYVRLGFIASLFFGGCLGVVSARNSIIGIILAGFLLLMMLVNLICSIFLVAIEFRLGLQIKNRK